MIAEDEKNTLKEESRSWKSWDLTERQLCDVELLLNGGFAPLKGFLGQADYESVCQNMRLASGEIWPIPITLDVDESFAKKISPGQYIALRDQEGVLLAALYIQEIYQPDKELEAKSVFGTTDKAHPGVKYLFDSAHGYYISGELKGIQLPTHYDFKELRLTPSEVKERFAGLQAKRIVAFQTRNPMHRAHQELTLRAAKEADAHLLIHPVVGMTKPGDVDHYTRVHCYKALLPHYPQGNVTLALLPLAMRMAGPREAVWHALIRKNYGCTHFIVGRDHAGPGNDSTGKPFYGPYDAQQLMQKVCDEIGITMVPFKEMLYVVDKDEYQPQDQVQEGEKTLNISGTELRRRLASGEEIPSWFTFPEVAKELQQRHPPRQKQGLTIFFTGLSGSGKSTIANVLLIKLLANGTRPVTLLDGDIVRKNLSSELGFSKEHRDLNIQRIGFVASEITKHGGLAICAPIAPYDTTRKRVRSMVQENGGFVLVHIATPIEVCEERDRKGLYAKARAGILKEFTGVSDPYEAPQDAEIIIDTTHISAEDAAEKILLYIRQQGYSNTEEVKA